jgi:hypothetical protein
MKGSVRYLAWAGVVVALGILFVSTRATISRDPWTWIGVFLTVAVFSFLYRENRLYRFAEHLVVGVANGYSISFTVHRVLVPYVVKPLSAGFKALATEGPSMKLLDPNSSANFIILVPLAIGLLYFTRFLPKHAWLVRIPMAIFMGYYTGQTVPAAFTGIVFPQLKATLVTQASFGGDPWLGVWKVLVLVGVLTTLTYFFFSREHKGALKWSAKTGIIYVMVGFGASFGFTVMARISLAIGRFYFLFRDWLGILH